MARALAGPALAVCCALLGAGCYSYALDLSQQALTAQGTVPRCDVILVPGCPATPDGKPSTCIRRRVDEAVRAWHEGAAPRMLFSGGAVHNDAPEALTMARYARALGVPERAIIVEGEARHTTQNIDYALPLLRAIGVRNVLVVTDALQLPAAIWMVRRHGLTPYGRLTHPPLSAKLVQRVVPLDEYEPIRSAWQR